MIKKQPEAENHMERPSKKIASGDIAATGFGAASQNAAAQASESLRHVDWFAVAEQCMIMSRLLTDQREK